jgi:hypothetical protein
VPDMKRHVTGFKCGRLIDGAHERFTATATVRERNRRRTVTGRRENPLEEAALELDSHEALATSGAEFENPVGWERSVGAVWRLL